MERVITMLVVGTVLGLVRQVSFPGLSSDQEPIAGEQS